MMFFSSIKKAILSRYSFGWPRLHLSSAPRYGNSYAMSGCGWLIPFYFGVIDAMKARGVMNNSSIYAGTSAGSLASLVATCDLDCKEVMVTLTRLAKDPAFTFDKNLGLKGVLKNLLPPDALERCQGRLHVTLTKVWPSPGSDAVIISNFTSLEHLVDVVAASCFIPLYSAQQLAVQIGNHPDHYIDGGVFAFMPPIGDVTISPFPQRFIYDLLPIRPDPRNASRAACIYLDKRDFPLRKLLPWVLLPPPEEGMWELFHRGEEAANRWMDRNAVSAGSSDEAKGSSKVRRISAVDVATPLPEERK